MILVLSSPSLITLTSGPFLPAVRHSQEVPNSYGLGHGPLIRDVLDAIEAGGRPPVDVDSAMTSLRLMHALYASLETGGWVDLRDAPVSTRLGRAR